MGLGLLDIKKYQICYQSCALRTGMGQVTDTPVCFNG